jgi:hypothetical protein
VPGSSVPDVAELPVRDLADARLADRVRAGGCPICRHRDDAASRFIDSMLWESVNDVTFRRELDSARGFCRRHTHDVLAADRRQSGGSVGSAILFGAVLAIRAAEFDAAQRTSGRARRRRLADAKVPPACPVCLEARRAEADAVPAVVRLSADPAWAKALALAELCIDHLLALLAEPDRPATWGEIEARQRARIEGLRGRLAAFAHNSSHDRRHLLTQDERAAADEAARLLGGTAGGER